MKKAREGMNEDEARFSVEFPLEQQALLWSDKYRPRKPRFFNRVHTVRTFISPCTDQCCLDWKYINTSWLFVVELSRLQFVAVFVFFRVLSGTNTIKPITTLTIHRQRLCRVTSLT